MVCTLYKNSMIRALNTKSGEEVYIDECYSRNEHKRKQLAIKILRGRQWAKENGYGRSSEIKFSYELPDSEPFPYELNLYKEKINEENQ